MTSQNRINIERDLCRNYDMNLDNFDPEKSTITETVKDLASGREYYKIQTKPLKRRIDINPPQEVEIEKKAHYDSFNEYIHAKLKIYFHEQIYKKISEIWKCVFTENRLDENIVELECEKEQQAGIIASVYNADLVKFFKLLLKKDVFIAYNNREVVFVKEKRNYPPEQETKQQEQKPVEITSKKQGKVQEKQVLSEILTQAIRDDFLDKYIGNVPDYLKQSCQRKVLYLMVTGKNSSKVEDEGYKMNVRETSESSTELIMTMQIPHDKDYTPPKSPKFTGMPQSIGTQVKQISRHLKTSMIELLQDNFHDLSQWWLQGHKNASISLIIEDKKGQQIDIIVIEKHELSNQEQQHTFYRGAVYNKIKDLQVNKVYTPQKAKEVGDAIRWVIVKQDYDRTKEFKEKWFRIHFVGEKQELTPKMCTTLRSEIVDLYEKTFKGFLFT